MAEDAKILNVLIPIAGKAQRFVDQGYQMPKPLIMVDGKCILDHAMDSLSCSPKDGLNYNLIFVIRRDHIQKYGLDKVIKSKYDNSKIVVAETDTEGALCTCLLAKKYINNHNRLLIFTPDIAFRPRVNMSDLMEEKRDGLIYTFKANSEAHSYAKVDENGQVTKTAEKEVISQNAAVGLYFFQHGDNFVYHAENAVEEQDKTKNEYYICPLYNRLYEFGDIVGIQPLERVHVLGTPEDVKFYEDHARKYCRTNTTPLKIGICSDHSGFEAKKLAEKIMSDVEFFNENDIAKIVDYGTYVNIPCDYSDYCKEACDGLKRGEVDIVLGFCRTGNGVNICANNQEGIISALVRDGYTAEHAVTHNCANFFAIPSRDVIDNDHEYNGACLKAIIWQIVACRFEGGRHATRLRKFL